MKVAKHCEWCGKYSENAFYRFISEVENMFFLNSPHISKIDTENRVIILKTGQTMDYSLLTHSGEAVSLVDCIPHIFCSEKCEDEFINKHSSLYTSTAPLKSAFIQLRKNGLFDPLSSPIESFQYQSARCETCDTDFPNISKIFYCSIIQESKTIEGRYDQPPNIEQSGYSCAHSDMNEGHPNGTWYLLRFDLGVLKKALFCSNECAFEYAESNNIFLIYKNNLFQGFMTCISPFTVRINQGLGNDYIYRPKKMWRN